MEKTSLNICILTHTFPRSKIDISAPFMDGVASGIAANKVNVFVLTPFSNLKITHFNKSYKLLTYKYIYPESLHKLGYSQTLKNDMGTKPEMFLLSPFMFLFGIFKLYFLVKKEKIDLINAHWILPNGFIAAVVSKVTGVPVVSTLPGSDVYMARKNKVFRVLARFSADNSSFITSNSFGLIKDLKKIKIKNKNFKEIIYGVDPKKFYPKKVLKLKKSLKIKSDELVVLSVGRLVAKKGFVYLIRAAELILKKNKKVKFLVVGEGDQRQELEELISEKKIHENFILLGAIDYKKLVDYYNLADIFILPSIRDEKGNLDDQSVALVEAMSCGKPVITTNFPGYNLVVSENENGYLVKEADETDIAEKIIKIIKDKDLRIYMGKKSRELVMKRFAWDKIGKQYLDLFEQVINKKTYYSEEVEKILEKKTRQEKADQILNVLSKEINNFSDKKCLDVGCSSGVITNILANKFKKVVGVDVDVKAVSQAKKDFKKKNLDFTIITSERLPFKDNSFDVIICNQVYNFVNNPDLMIKEIYRVLKKDGLCFFGGRNKAQLIEPQFGLPFLSWLPKNLAEVYLRAFKGGKRYVGFNYMTYFQLRKLVKKFKVEDYSLKIVKNPDEYNFQKLSKYKYLFNLFPDSFISLMPNYIWILKKKL